MNASENGHNEVVKLLLDHGADTNIQSVVSVTHMINMSDVSVCTCVCVNDGMINFLFFWLFLSKCVE